MIEQIVNCIPLTSNISVSGQELVQVSRAKDFRYTAIGAGNDHPGELVVNEKHLKIGTNEGNLKFVRSREEETCAYFKGEITKLSINYHEEADSFDDGCDFLLKNCWYRRIEDNFLL
jgi:hypothetical protein